MPPVANTTAADTRSVSTAPDSSAPVDASGTPVEKRVDLMVRRREELDMSQKLLARHLGTTQATICRWELGLREPNRAEAARIAEVLKIPVDQLEAELRRVFCD